MTVLVTFKETDFSVFKRPITANLTIKKVGKNRLTQTVEKHISKNFPARNIKQWEIIA